MSGISETVREGEGGGHLAASSSVAHRVPWPLCAIEAAIAARVSDAVASDTLSAGPLVVEMESARDWLLSDFPMTALNPALSKLAGGRTPSRF